MKFSTIHKALDDRLKLVPQIPTIQEENVLKKLGPGTTSYCRSTLLPARTNPETLGPNGYNKLHGLFQVDLYYPQYETYTNCYDMVDNILSKFIMGTQLGNVLIMNSYPIAGSSSTLNYYSVSVVIEWLAYEQRQFT